MTIDWGVIGGVVTLRGSRVSCLTIEVRMLPRKETACVISNVELKAREVLNTST